MENLDKLKSARLSFIKMLGGGPQCHNGESHAEEEPVRILARNEPPEFECAECGKPAAWINVWEDYTLLCDECADVEYDEGFLPVVNSPRVGVCGYTGPYDPEVFEPQ